MKQKEARKLKVRELQFKAKAKKYNRKEESLGVKQPNGTYSMGSEAGGTLGEKYLKKSNNANFNAVKARAKRRGTDKGEVRYAKANGARNLGIEIGQLRTVRNQIVNSRIKASKKAK